MKTYFEKGDIVTFDLEIETIGGPAVKLGTFYGCCNNTYEVQEPRDFTDVVYISIHKGKSVFYERLNLWGQSDVELISGETARLSDCKIADVEIAEIWKQRVEVHYDGIKTKEENAKLMEEANAEHVE